MRAAVIVALAGCGGAGAPVVGPVGKPVVQVVRCEPAMPAPLISAVGLDVEPLGSARELARFRMRGRIGRAAIPPTKAVAIEALAIVSGGMGRTDVTGMLQGALPDLERCLATHRAAQSTPTTLTASFVIEPNGTLTLVSTTGPAAPALRSCVSDALRALRAHRPAGSPAGPTSRVSVRLVFDPGALTPRSEAQPATPGEPWTPYAIDLGEPLDTAPQIARSLEAVLARETDALEACFAHSRATGSVRAMLEIDARGRVEASRVGGLGDRAIETCLHDALAGLEVTTPAADAAEIACDLSRGDAAPWRVTPGAGYEEIDVTATQVSYGSLVLAPEAEPAPLRDGVTYLVVVDPDTSGALLDRALAWAHEGDGTLVAVRAPSGPPVLLGMGRSVYAVAADDDGAARTSTVVVDGRTVTTCERMPMGRAVATMSTNASLSDPRAVSGLLADLAAHCREDACTGTLGVAIDKATTVRDLVEIVGTARVHGFDRVLLGSGGCAPPPRDPGLDD